MKSQHPMLCIAIFILDRWHTAGRQQTDHLRTFLPQAKTESRSCDSLRERASTHAHTHPVVDSTLQSVRACLVAVLLSKKQWSLKKKIENRRLLSFSFASLTHSVIHSFLFGAFVVVVFFRFRSAKLLLPVVFCREEKIAHFHLPTVAATMLLKCIFSIIWRAFTR